MPRWKDGSRGMLTVNALFAGFAGVLLINLAFHELDGSSRTLWSVILAGVALWSFAFAAERITDALDEGDPSTYLTRRTHLGCGGHRAGSDARSAASSRALRATPQR
jgi:hypothetical protein